MPLYQVTREDVQMTRLVHVVVDVLDVRGLASFWSKALGWRLAEKFFQYDEGVVQASDRSGLEVICVPTRTPKGVKNRIHLDLSTTSVEDQHDIVRRLLADGASRVDIGQGEVPWVVLADPEGNEWAALADPEGNEFCILTPR